MGKLGLSSTKMTSLRLHSSSSTFSGSSFGADRFWRRTTDEGPEVTAAAAAAAAKKIKWFFKFLFRKNDKLETSTVLNSLSVTTS